MIKLIFEYGTVEFSEPQDIIRGRRHRFPTLGKLIGADGDNKDDVQLVLSGLIAISEEVPK